MKVNGKQLKGLADAITACADDAHMDHVVAVDTAHVYIVECLDRNPLGVESDRIIDLAQLKKLKIEDVDFEARMDGNYYVLESEDITYRVRTEDADDAGYPTVPQLDCSESIDIDAKAFLKAVEKCALVSDHCTIQGGRLMASDGDSDVNVKLCDCNTGVCRSMFNLEYLKPVAKIMKGTVHAEIGTDYPIRFTWTDGYLNYLALVAPRLNIRD